jgi:hypothetical protein
VSIAGRFGWRWYAGAAAVVVGLGPLGGGNEMRPVQNAEPPSLEIVSPVGGSAVAGNVAILDVRVSGVGLGAPDPSNPSRNAHLHVFVDREPPPDGVAIPVERGIVHASSSPVAVPGLTQGVHKLSVALGDGAHVRLGDEVDSVIVSVGGPVLQARAAATAVEGDPWTIDVGAQGVRLVKADGDTSGRTGHLHFFIDGALPPPDVAIPEDAENVVHTEQTEVPLTGLAAGDHVVWIVLGDGAHRPFYPYVADVVRVTITAAE